MPTRKVGPSRRSVTGRVNVPQSGRRVASESTLERDFLRLTRFDPSVSGVEEQPVRLTYKGRDGKEHPYTPDFLVRYRRQGGRRKKPLLCEVKYASEVEANGEKYAGAWETAHKYAQKQGWEFRVLTEVEIRTPRLENARFFWYHRRSPPDKNRSRVILQTLARIGETNLRMLINALSVAPIEQAHFQTTIYELIAGGEIGFDFDAPRSWNSRVWLPVAAETERDDA